MMAIQPRFMPSICSIKIKRKQAGAAVKAGTGMFPGTIDKDLRAKDAFKTFWMNAPVTIPLFKNEVSWDLMPGASMTRNYGEEHTTAWAFTYSTRLAWYPRSPKWSLVGEVFGSAGKTGSIPEFKTGFRWDQVSTPFLPLPMDRSLVTIMVQGLSWVLCYLRRHLLV